MSIVLRSAESRDLEGLYDLSRQFTLLNLPSDKRIIGQMIEKSMASFSGSIDSKDGLYIFVAEDRESDKVVASSLIHGRCGTEDSPNYSFQIQKRDLFSQGLGIGFIHQVLKLKADADGPTEVGGLLVDKSYRRRPEKVGRQISFLRFCYIAENQDRFTDTLHVELAPPLTAEGRSEFWESLGRRFTGLPYQEADSLSQQNKEFIESLFPSEEIYLCLLDSKARLVVGRVGEETRPALHLLESIGFKYIDEIDPFDGGPHYRAKVGELTPIKSGFSATISSGSGNFAQRAILGCQADGAYLGGAVSYERQDDKVFVAPGDMKRLGLESGTKVFLSPLEKK